MVSSLLLLLSRIIIGTVRSHYLTNHLQGTNMKLITTIFLTLFPLITFANSSLPANRHITVQGTAEVLVEPDMANISFEVISTKDTLLEAKRDLDTQINLLLEGVDKYGFELNDVFVSGLKSNDIQYYWYRNGDCFRR